MSLRSEEPAEHGTAPGAAALGTAAPGTAAPQELDALRAVLAPLGRAERAERLTGGMFATTFLVTFDDGSDAVVKTAPTHEERLLTYEHDLVRSEALVYRLLADVPGVPVPRVLLEDFTRTAWPGDVLAASRLGGTPWGECGLGPVDDDLRAARAQHELGALMARLHTVTGRVFGYVGEGSALRAPTWQAAFGLMVEAALRDAERWSVPMPAEEVRASLHRHGPALAQVAVPVLVHTDLWPGNLFLDAGTGSIVGVIDPERAVWGDPLLELVGADQLGRGPVPAGLLAGYASAGPELDPTEPATAARLELYRLYFSLIMQVEMVPRAYTGGWVEAHRATLEANLRAGLDALA